MKLRGKKILVTGAGGFIGSHLVEALLALGSEVRAMVRYNSSNSWGWLEGATSRHPGLEIFPGDIRDHNGVAEAMKDCQIVFHLAALIGIPFSYHSPDTYVDVNVKGTLNILQAARRMQIERVLVTSTSEVYGTAQYVPIDEEHPLQAQSPYSASKIGADKIAESFFRSFALPVVIVRPFNTYGPRQSARAIIPTIIAQLLNGSENIQLGSLEPTRDFNHVSDTVNGFIAIAQSDIAIGQEINIATGKEYSMRDVADILVSEINPSAVICTSKERFRPQSSEVFRLLGNNDKITSMTSWKPKFDLVSGLRDTISWFKKSDNISQYKSWLYNL